MPALAKTIAKINHMLTFIVRPAIQIAAGISRRHGRDAAEKRAAGRHLGGMLGIAHLFLRACHQAI